MKFVKVTAGRHHAWFEKIFIDGTTLPVRESYIPPEGCHSGCGLVGKGRVIKPPAAEKIKIETALPKVRLSWWKRVWLFIKRIFTHG